MKFLGAVGFVGGILCVIGVGFTADKVMFLLGALVAFMLAVATGVWRLVDIVEASLHAAKYADTPPEFIPKR